MPSGGAVSPNIPRRNQAFVPPQGSVANHRRRSGGVKGNASGVAGAIQDLQQHSIKGGRYETPGTKPTRPRDPNGVMLTQLGQSARQSKMTKAQDSRRQSLLRYISKRKNG